MKFIFAGDSWALKGFTEENYSVGNNTPLPGDQRLADYIGLDYELAVRPGRGNLAILDCILQKRLDPKMPVVWVYTEPGRDYGRITNKPEFDWITSEDIFAIRTELNRAIFQEIKTRLPNPVAFIGGLSDIDVNLAQEFGFDVLEPSWQHWIAQTVNSHCFQFGWGASDIGWRTHYNNVTPSKAATFAWDEQIMEWCSWEEQGYFCHEHPTPKANQEFAKYIGPKLIKWVEEHEQRR